MQNFHYNYIKNKYDNKVEMLPTDTDSFMYNSFFVRYKEYIKFLHSKANNDYQANKEELQKTS